MIKFEFTNQESIIASKELTCIMSAINYNDFDCASAESCMDEDDMEDFYIGYEYRKNRLHTMRDCVILGTDSKFELTKCELNWISKDSDVIDWFIKNVNLEDGRLYQFKKQLNFIENDY